MGFSPFARVVSGFDVVKAIYAGYGERPDQSLITQHGDAYVSQRFPKIDRIKSVTLVKDSPQ
jgi:peptidyl-prolyl cis-trans isomerase A (cyclophilin A)